MKLAILCHWHTASTLLAKQLRLCGMEVGNGATFWDPETCDPQCEHALLNGIGDKFLIGEIGEGTLKKTAKKILDSYSHQAEANGWEHLGVKATHCIHDRTWPIFRNLFMSTWDDLRFITIFRHVDGIIQSTHDPRWDEQRIKISWFSCMKAIQEIITMQNGLVFFYPMDWEHGFVEHKVRSIGLEWNKEAKSLFDPSRVKEGEGG